MKSNRQSRSTRDRTSHLSGDAERLVSSALGLANSGSRNEDRFWDALLARYLDALLSDGHAQPVYDALDRLHQTDLEAYGALVEAVEENAESLITHQDGADWQILLVTAPLIAWTRFHIPTQQIDESTSSLIQKLWCKHVLAPGARLALMPAFVSVDQLPRDYADLRTLTRSLGEQAITGQAPSDRKLPDSAQLLADARFLVGAVAVPVGSPVFRWQCVESAKVATRVQVLEKWVKHSRPIASQLLPGCGFESLLPDAFHINMRESDRRVRGYGIRAAVHYLTHAVGVSAGDIRAVVAGFGYARCDEVRIGFTLDPQGEALAHGVLWPLFGIESEADDPSPIEKVRDLLIEAGIKKIAIWEELSEPEFCEDCGAPLYPNEKGDVEHAELPADAMPESIHFH